MQTVIYLNPSTGQQVKVSGTIQDYNRNNLILETISQQIKTIPSDSIISIQAKRPVLFDEAQTRIQEGQFEQAIQLLEKVYTQTSEDWLKQEILSIQIENLNKIGEYRSAILKYIQLTQQAPQNVYFDSVPLVWTSSDFSPKDIETAQQCISQQKFPFVTLIGASILLTSDKKSEVLNTLKILTQSDDTVVSTLAQIQIHRLTLTPLSKSEIKKLETLVDALPQKLQYGPRFVLAQLWNRCLSDKSENLDKTVLQYLQCSQNSKTPLELQARSLFSAGHLLYENGYKDEALRIFNNLIQKYSDSSWADQAKRTVKGTL